MATSMPNARLAFDKGQAFFEQRKWDEALAAFRVAVDKDPEMSEGWYQIGMAEMLKNGARPSAMQRSHGRSGSAPTSTRTTRARSAASATCCCTCATTCRAPRSTSSTRSGSMPNFAPAHRGLAGVLEQRGDLDETIRAMLEYVRLSGDPDGSGKAHVAGTSREEEEGRRRGEARRGSAGAVPPPLVAPAPRLRVRATEPCARRPAARPSARTTAQARYDEGERSGSRGSGTTR